MPLQLNPSINETYFRGGCPVILMGIYCTDFVIMCCRSLAVGTKNGYKLFSLTTVEKLDCIHESGQYII